MNGLPQSYMSPMHLPFNRTSLQRRFELQTPALDPGGPGCWVALQGNSLLVAQRDAMQLPGEDFQDFFSAHSKCFLGLWDGRPCRLASLEPDVRIPEDLCKVRYIDDNPMLPITLLSLAGLARMILHWESRSEFCPACGASMQRLPADWGRNCPDCLTHHFPQISPCAIVLVRRPGEILLTRKANWAPNRYSLVAGFMEVGECLEETATREVAEETGIIIHNLRYIGSQSWPFPSQLMCGFVADYEAGEIRVDIAELEDARWFPLHDLPALPPKRSIARYILDTELKLSL
ncbi:MAG: NAD(+) diphosphatase [Deltaproteobacteria bacterium]|nr:NAD(+) diphosphatase [Deltaproteobacteria bacterium]